MPGADFFAKLGLYTQREFLTAEECEQILADMTSATGGVSAGVFDQHGEAVIDAGLRSTRVVHVSEPVMELVKTRFEQMMPVVARHFETPLTGFEYPQFLVYKEGDFFKLHLDKEPHPDAPAFSRERKVSVVLFVNGKEDEESLAGYEGGELTLYSVLDDPTWKDKGFPLVAEPGLFLGFRSETPHEVTPVTRGKRLTIVTWYF